MSERVSKALDALQPTAKLESPWVGARYEWFKALPSTDAGNVGEQIALEVLGGKTVGRSSGYDVLSANNRRTEVKLCRRSFTKSNVWSWKQIRRDDDYDDLCLIAVEPNDCRMFVIPRECIPPAALSNNHGRQGDGSLSQIAWPKDPLPEWILKWEVK